MAYTNLKFFRQKIVFLQEKSIILQKSVKIIFIDKIRPPKTDELANPHLLKSLMTWTGSVLQKSVKIIFIDKIRPPKTDELANPHLLVN